MKVINEKPIFILGQEIEFRLKDESSLFVPTLDEEVYEISQSILDGYTYGELLINSINKQCTWMIEGSYYEKS